MRLTDLFSPISQMGLFFVCCLASAINCTALFGELNKCAIMPLLTDSPTSHERAKACNYLSIQTDTLENAPGVVLKFFQMKACVSILIESGWLAVAPATPWKLLRFMLPKTQSKRPKIWPVWTLRNAASCL